MYGACLAVGHPADDKRVMIDDRLARKFRYCENSEFDVESGVVTIQSPFNTALLFDSKGVKHFWPGFALLPDNKLDALIDGLGGVFTFDTVDICNALRTVFYRRKRAVDVEGKRFGALIR